MSANLESCWFLVEVEKIQHNNIALFAVLVGYYRVEAVYIALCLAQRNAGPACHKVSSCDEALSMPNLKLNKNCNKWMKQNALPASPQLLNRCRPNSSTYVHFYELLFEIKSVYTLYYRYGPVVIEVYILCTE